MRYLLFFALLIGAVFAECVSCEELQGAPKARLLLELDGQQDNVLNIYAFYENLSASPTRQPIDNYVLVVQITNQTGLQQLYRVYTDDGGAASFDFTQWSEGCINFRVLYCPFCDEDSPVCAFGDCMNYSSFETDATSITGIPLGPGESIPGTLNENKYLPTFVDKDYCPPPPEIEAAPAMCLPLLIIFSLLSGALYLSGRNPFAGFNIGGARVGRHIRYQARGRGYSFSGMAALSAASSIAGTIATLGRADEYHTEGPKKGQLKRRGGFAGLVDQETAAASQRGGFFVTQIQMTGAAAKRGAGMVSIFAKAPGFKAAISRIETTSKDAGKPGGAAQLGAAPGAGGAPLFMPGSAAFSPRIGELFGEQGGFGLGFLYYAMTATTLGSLLDNVVYRASGKTMFESKFIDYSKRAEADMKTLDAMAQENFKFDAQGNITGFKMKGASGQLTLDLLAVRNNGDGTKTYVFEEPPSRTGPRTADGKINVTLDENNEIVRIQSVCAGVVPPTANNPGGFGIVTVQFDVNGKEQYYVQPSTADGTPQGDAKRSEKPVGVGSIGEMFVGSNMSSYVSNYESNISSMASIAEGIAETSQTVSSTANEVVNDYAESNATAKLQAGKAREKMASEAIAVLANLNPGESEGVVSLCGDQKPREVATNVDQGFKKANVGESVHRGLGSAFSLDELATKSPEELRAAYEQKVAQQYEQQLNLSKTRAGVVAASEVRAMPDSTFQDAHTAANTFVSHMEGAGTSQQAMAAIRGSSFSQLNDVQYAGGAPNAAILVSSPHVDRSALPEKLRTNIGQVEYFSRLEQTAGSMAAALKPQVPPGEPYTVDFAAYGNANNAYKGALFDATRRVAVDAYRTQEDVAPEYKRYADQYAQGMDTATRAREFDQHLYYPAKDPSGRRMSIPVTTKQEFAAYEKTVRQEMETAFESGDTARAAELALHQYNVYAAAGRAGNKDAAAAAGAWGQSYEEINKGNLYLPPTSPEAAADSIIGTREGLYTAAQTMTATAAENMQKAAEQAAGGGGEGGAPSPETPPARTRTPKTKPRKSGSGRTKS